MASGDKPRWSNVLHICRRPVTPNSDPGREHIEEHSWRKPVKLWTPRAQARFNEGREAIILQCPDHDGLGGGDAPVQSARA